MSIPPTNTSETPRTDAEYKRRLQLYPQSVTTHEVVNISFARQLERELNAAKAELKELWLSKTAWANATQALNEQLSAAVGEREKLHKELLLYRTLDGARILGIDLFKQQADNIADLTTQNQQLRSVLEKCFAALINCPAPIVTEEPSREDWIDCQRTEALTLARAELAKS